jgi:hypothetical protein
MMRGRAAAVIVAGLVLAACGSGSHAPHAAGTSAATPSLVSIPAVGDCYDLPPAQVDDPLVSPGRVDCNGPHDAETVFVLATALHGVQHYPRHVAETSHGPVVGSADDEVGGQRDPVRSNLDAVCNDHLVTAYLGGEDQQAMDDVFARSARRLPSAREWAAGARWVRCDAVYGTDTPRTAPGLMRNALHRADAAAFRGCLAGLPTGDQHSVPCSAAHQAEVVDFWPSVPDGTPFPATAAARHALAEDLCGRAVRAYARGEIPVGYVADVWPGPPENGQGDLLSCLVSRADGATTMTTVVPTHG